MKMRLQEAKEILKKAGYLVRSLNEDTETDDDEIHDTMMDDPDIDDVDDAEWQWHNSNYERSKKFWDRRLDSKLTNAKWYNLIGKNYKKYLKYLKSLGIKDWYIDNMLRPENFMLFYGNEGVNTIEELEKVMKDKAKVFLQAEKEDEERERKEQAKKSLPFINQAYDAFIDSAELEEDDDTFNISKTKNGFNFAYKKSVWGDLGEWPIVQISITPDSIKWKLLDEDGKLISNEKKLSGSTEKKLAQIERWVNNEWWGYPD